MQAKNYNKFKKISAIIFNIFFWIIFVLLLIAGVISMKLYGEYKRFERNLIETSNIQNYQYNPSETTKIYTSDGELLATLYDEYRTYVSYNHIPDNLKKAFIAIEDENFYKHKGVDIKGIIRAAIRNVMTRSMQGGSTITQQFVKNAILTNEKTIERKIKEIIIARELEKKFSKEKILEMYLNEVSFGGQIYGVQAASKIFFGKDVSELTLAESALLAGMVKAPTRYSPILNYDKSIKRMKVVLNKMYQDGIITKEEYEKAKNEKIEIVKRERKSTVTTYKYPYFTTFVVKELEKKYGKKIYSSGWNIYTTLDSEMQEYAIKAIKNGVDRYGKTYGFNNAALVCIENETGQVKAFVGGYDFEKDQNNLAVIPRQPGSAIKPITYATAFEKKVIGMTDLIKDEKITFGKWSPRNYDNKYHGYMTVMEAIKRSNNVIAVKVLNKVGVNNVISYAKRMGITTIVKDDYVLPFTLGGMTYGIKPYEMAGAYTTFPNKGAKVETSFILFIKDKNNNIIEKYNKKEKRIFSKTTANKINYILSQNVISGTGVRAKIGKPVAGKTGTTSKSTSVWFIGYTPDITTAVWVGNSDNTPMKKGATGGRIAAPIFAEYMKKATQKYKTRGFNVRYNFEDIAIDIETGLLATEYCPEENVKIFKMLKNSIPFEKCDLHKPSKFATYYDINGKEYSVPLDENGNIMVYPKDEKGNVIELYKNIPIINNEEVNKNNEEAEENGEMINDINNTQSENQNNKENSISEIEKTDQLP